MEERTKIGVFETVASITATEPTVCFSDSGGEWLSEERGRKTNLGVLSRTASLEIKADLAVVD